ncbi:MAG: hypothetical protein KDB53_09930 [Planctomycetes bacterium]|nr:hypothetical protein [Planctomycetota bacterium]
MSTKIHQIVEACRQGREPRRVCRVDSGWVVLGESQFLRGYSLLLPDPVVPHLNALEPEARQRFLWEMSILGDALLELTGAVRMNYEMLGNLEPALHAHVFPRYAEEPEDLRTKPVWSYDWMSGPLFDVERHAPLVQSLRDRLRAAGIAR